MNFDQLYHQHVSQFSGLGEGFTPQSDFNLFVHTVVVSDIVNHGRIREDKFRYFATMIRDSIDNRN